MSQRVSPKLRQGGQLGLVSCWLLAAYVAEAVSMAPIQPGEVTPIYPSEVATIQPRKQL